MGKNDRLFICKPSRGPSKAGLDINAPIWFFSSCPRKNTIKIPVDRFIKVGKILKPVGLKGQVLVRACSQMESLLIPGSCFIKAPSGKYEEFFISASSPRGRKEAVLDIRWVDSRNKAERISKREVFQLRSRLPAGEEDEFYWFELTGLRVTTSRGKFLGRVHSIIETGAGDVLAVRDEAREILIPLVDQVIKQVDIKDGKCIVDLPPGLEEATATRLKPAR